MLARWLPYLRGFDFRQIVPATPAAGADWTTTMGAGPGGNGVPYGILVSGIFLLTTSATVANRQPGLKITRSGIILSEFTATLQCPASQTNVPFEYDVGTTWGQQVAALGGTSNGGIVHIPDFILLAGDVVSGLSGNLQAGDQWTPQSLWFASW